MKKISPEMLVFRDYLGRKRLKETPHRRLILDTFLAGEGVAQSRQHAAT